MAQFGIARRAHAGTARPPSADELVERLLELAPRLWDGAAVKPAKRGVTLSLFPGAPRVRVLVTGAGELTLTAATACVGPAYHAQVATRVSPVAEELGLAWDPADDDGTGAEPEMCAWIADELRAGAPRVAMPVGRVIHVPAPAVVQTPLGPRDAAWRAAVLADPAHAVDALAWRVFAPGHAPRARALLAMWHELPWRTPLDAAERAAMEAADTDLRNAHHADPELPLPWAAWAELLALLQRDDAHAEVVRARARAAPAPAPIGYRRFERDVDLSGGWTIVLPGAFAGGWDAAHTRYTARDGRRTVELTMLTAAGEADSARLLDVAPEAFPVIARVDEGGRRGRAEREDRDTQMTIHAVMARAPHVVLATLRGAPADEPWALAAWRSLTHAPKAR